MKNKRTKTQGQFIIDANDKHKSKYDFCMKLNIKLIRIRYDQDNEFILEKVV